MTDEPRNAASTTPQTAIGRLMPILVTLGLLSLVLFGALTFRTYNRLTEEAQQLRTTLEVRTHLLGTLSGAFALEAIYAEYALTENAALASDFADTQAVYASFAAQAREDLPAMHPELRRDLQTMLDRIQRQQAGFASLFARAQREGGPALREPTAQLYAAIADASVLEPYQRFQGRHAALVAQSTDTMARLQRRLAGLVIASLISGLLIALFVTFYMRRFVRSLATSRLETRSAVAQTEVARADTAQANAARGHAEHEQERVETLLQEMNHRIGNSLGMVSALMGLQRARSDDSNVRDALEAARTRIHAVATAHRRLRLAPDMETTDLAPVLTDMAHDLRATQPRDDITLETDFINADVSDRDAVTLGLLMSELITNAFKHAFRGREGGTVWVDTSFDETASFVLRVQDDGVGMGPDGAATAGLGSTVVARMSKQFGGTLDYSARPGGGTCVAIIMPGLAVAARP